MSITETLGVAVQEPIFSDLLECLRSASPATCYLNKFALNVVFVVIEVSPVSCYFLELMYSGMQFPEVGVVYF